MDDLDEVPAANREGHCNDQHLHSASGLMISSKDHRLRTYFLGPKQKSIDSNEIYHFFRGGPGFRDISPEDAAWASR